MMVTPSANPLVLLVEGRDDLHVVAHLCNRSAFEPWFCIKDKGGVPALMEDLALELKASELTIIGIVLDADRSLNNRWQSIKDKLRQSSIELPTVPVPTGTIIDGPPRIGVWIMPDNQSTGELENFIEAMIPTGDHVWPRSEAYIDGIPETDRKFASQKTLKAKVHAWLAAREEPRPMGLAIRAGDLDIGVSQAQAFLNWLRDLFS